MTSPAAWVAGATTVHRVIDIDPAAFAINVLFPAASLDELQPYAAALANGHLDFAAGNALLAMQSHLVRFAGKTILIDACIGEHKSRPLRPHWNQRADTRYLANLAAAGCAPADIDIVMCTHLHADHVGWNTRLQSGQWVPTFPNARYLMSQREIDQRAQEAAANPQANHGSYQDSVLPILERGMAKTVKAGDEIAEGAAIIDLAGHAPGQIGLDLIAGPGARAVFCGDAIHSPLQVYRPEWSSAFCFDAAHAARTRRSLLERAAGEDLLLMPAHLRGTGMRITEKAGGFVPIIGG
jgi:glyoxylase-like metal-dependent hydrolase (beta-lactamase superfamily II)